MTLGLPALYDLCEATWPPARVWTTGGTTFRDGAGGGKRVSAATCEAVPDLKQAEAEMRGIGQRPLFMIREGENALDEMLAEAGYGIIDPVHVYVAPVKALTDIPIPKVTAFEIWEPLAIMVEIWAQGGIGPERLEVMGRAAQKTGILSRLDDKPAGVAFCGLHGDAAMVHAVEVLPHQRRKGAAQWMMRKAAFWAAGQGANWMSVLCTKANTGANALYAGMGFQIAGSYHYRIKEAT